VLLLTTAIALALAALGCGGGSSSSSTPPASRGIKGENPTREAASSAHISPADCVALQKLAEERLGVTL
jgi:hypothetical protein